MFKKGPDIDKKKLLSKASDVKKDSVTRLKHFKTLIEHLEFNELPVLFRTHFSFIYHTFIDTFSTFDCNSKQRRDDLECILFMLEKILTYNPELIKKRWQFYSITFVMQKLLHQNNTWQLRLEGARLFILWYQILCDETNPELQTMFACLVRGIVPQSSLPLSSPTTPSDIPTSRPHHHHHLQQQQQYQQHQQYPVQSKGQQQQQQQQQTNNNMPPTNLPTKIDPLVPMSPNEQLPSDETSFYLDSLLQYLVTQTTKPIWGSPDEARKNQELGFSFTFNMFKKIYLPHLFPNFNVYLDSPTRAYISTHSINQYVDEVNDTCQYLNINQSLSDHNNKYTNYNDVANTTATATSPPVPSSPSALANVSVGGAKRDPLHIDLMHSNHFISSPSPLGQSSIEQERTISLSSYQAIVIKWLTRILRQDIIPGQDELIRAGSGSVERQQTKNNNNIINDNNNKSKNRNENSSSGQNDADFHQTLEANSSTIFQGIETSSREMEIARRVIGTWPENIQVIHELFRRAFLNYYQPASMKRVVNVYKEWICNGGPNQANLLGVGSRGASGPAAKIGYISFSDLLQVFVLNSSSAFVARVQNAQMLEEQVEMCKRIMNIYRYMVMKIYMNTSTWEQLLNVMLSITERLFPMHPPDKKEDTIGGRIAPAFFQTFIVSWIRANLYVHISGQMWHEFHRVMKSLVRWRELVEEWRTTMGSLTRVLVKHVYGLSLTDLPLDRPQERRRRPKATKSFSTAEQGSPNKSLTTTAATGAATAAPMAEQTAESATTATTTTTTTRNIQNNAPNKTTATTPTRTARSGSIKLPATSRRELNGRGRLARSNSYGTLFQDKSARLYYSSLSSKSADHDDMAGDATMRKIKSEYFLLESSAFYSCADGRSGSPSSHNDVIDGTSLKDSNMIIEHDHTLDSHSSSCQVKGANDSGNKSTSGSRRQQQHQQQENSKILSDKCVLLGGSVRGWTSENSVIMWRRMLGLFGNINHIEDIDNHFVAIKCLESILNDFIKTRENLGVSLDNQSSPEQPQLIPPYTYPLAWLLEATHLPRQYRDSRMLAHELLCLMFIRRHDIELSAHHYAAFYEVLQRALGSPDPAVHASIIKNTAQLLSFELPGCTFLVPALYERSRAMLASLQKGQPPGAAAPRDQAIQMLNTILALHRPIRKLVASRPPEPRNNSSSSGLYPSSTTSTTGAFGDLKNRVFDTLLACNIRPVILDSQTRCKSLCSMALHVYQELYDKTTTTGVDKELADVEKLFDTLLGELQSSNDKLLFRMNCDLLRLFADHGQALANSRPVLVATILQTICQLIVRFSLNEDKANNNNNNSNNKDLIHFMLICLEEWCLSVGKSFLIKPISQFASLNTSTRPTSNEGLAEQVPGESPSLITIILRSLEKVINDEQRPPMDESVALRRAGRGSIVQSSPKGQNSDNNNSSQSENPDEVSQSQPTSPDTANHQTTGLASATNLSSNQNMNNKNSTAIKLACKVSHHKLITYLGHFPFRQVGAASMSCCVNESDYLTASEHHELADFKSTPGVFLLVIDGSTIISFIGATGNRLDCRRPLHLIIRNLCGKYSWDVSCLEDMISSTTSVYNNQQQQTDNGSKQANETHSSFIVMDPETFQEASTRSTMKYDSDFNEDGANSSSSLSSRSSSGRDCISDLLQQLSVTMAYAQAMAGSSSSPSSSSIASYQMQMQRKRNSAQSVSNPKFKLAQAEETMIALLTNQRFQELNYCDNNDDMDRGPGVVLKLGTCDGLQPPVQAQQVVPLHQASSNELASIVSSSSSSLSLSSSSSSYISLEQCRQLVQQLGYLSWEKRCKIDSLAKSTRLLRELKNLDAQSSRETHKIAVIYVAAGQEDKNSILMNSSGSRAFEEFVAGLGWEVNLASHLGFKGGLQSNKSTGETSCYYCNATTEVMFHVSTKIPIGTTTTTTAATTPTTTSSTVGAPHPLVTTSSTTTCGGSVDDESLNKKLRHLGNDEIHIVWSEHTRDYRRGIIPTEFGDVVIAIYPMLTFQGYYRVQISSKQEVPPFGPLFDNCLVHQSSLAALVRASAINASRAKRLTLPYYQSHFEERSRLIDTLVRNHKEKLSFEEFAMQLYNSGELIRGSVVGSGSGCGSTCGQQPTSAEKVF